MRARLFKYVTCLPLALVLCGAALRARAGAAPPAPDNEARLYVVPR